MIASAALLLFCAAQTPWHLAGWQARAVVEIRERQPDADAAGVKVLCLGRAKADGSDYRVLDAAGKPVAFRVMFHDAARYSLLAFAAREPQAGYYVYFDNPNAAVEQLDWQPLCGLIYETIQRPEGENPKMFEQMQQLMAGSKAKYGVRWQRRISDGFNPFGPSDYFISIYRGWVRIPKAGKYWFCTASNEASFSFLDGKPLVHWPGRHTEERGVHGEKNAGVELTEGLHYLEYYHEEVTLQQVAFLGWRPLRDEGPFEGIPESVYTAPHSAEVTRYENRDGAALPVFEPQILDSIWPEDRPDAQYTRVRFASGEPVEWDFGDGQTARGGTVEHVYLRLGTYTVTLNGTTRWPLEVYDIQHVNDQVPEGKLSDYLKIIRGYDRAKLDEAAQSEWLALVGETVPDFEWLLAHESPPERKLKWLARLIELQPAKAEELLTQAEQITRETKKTDEVYAAYRHALIAVGDARLWSGQLGEALEVFRRAEATDKQVIPLPVRAARVGSYPNAVREYLAVKDTDAAWETLEQWERTFPTEKLKGHSFFWRGRTQTQRGRPKDAARYFAKCLDLAPGADFESEARWLLAESLEKTGKADEAKRELAKLAASGLQDDFVRQAKERLR